MAGVGRLRNLLLMRRQAGGHESETSAAYQVEVGYRDEPRMQQQAVAGRTIGYTLLDIVGLARRFRVGRVVNNREHLVPTWRCRQEPDRTQNHLEVFRRDIGMGTRRSTEKRADHQHPEHWLEE